MKRGAEDWILGMGFIASLIMWVAIPIIWGCRIESRLGVVEDAMGIHGCACACEK